jgi:hypothetical protein
MNGLEQDLNITFSLEKYLDYQTSGLSSSKSKINP